MTDARSAGVPKGLQLHKTLATIDQMFSIKTSPKDKVLLENEIVEMMMQKITPTEVTEVDSLVVSNFVEKFNNKYSDDLLEEQQELLTHYILSFTDNAVSLKMFLNNEISRLKEALGNSTSVDEIRSDKTMIEKTERIVEKLNSYAKSPVTEEILLSVLKTQSLVKEIYDNGSNN